MEDRIDDLSEADRRRLLVSPPDGNLLASIRLVVRSFAGDRWLPVHEVAELAGMSVRSLQRELAEHGISYRDIVDEVRFALASEMLKGGELEIDSITSALGYSSKSNFARAFERWSGDKPAVFRTKNQ